MKHKGRRKSTKAAANRRYYLKHRERLKALAKERYCVRKAESIHTENKAPEPVSEVSPESTPEPQERKGLFSQWIQRLRSTPQESPVSLFSKPDPNEDPS